MQADTIKRLRELPERLRHAAATEMNDDYTEPMSEKRLRMTARVDAMLAAGDAIEELLALAEGAEADRAAAYDAGFMASGEGWNGEHGGDTDSRYYLAKRAEYFAAIDAALAGAVTQGEGS